MPNPTPTVRQYYDHNTARFLRHGQHEHTRNIHQPLWAEGISSVEQAVSYSNRLVLKQLNKLGQNRSDQELQVLDLGCGVGSSVLYLAEHFAQPAQFTGISISSVQIEYAQRFGEEHIRGQRCRFLTGDFLDLPTLPPIDLAFAIEAFLHATDAQRFFAQVAQKLKPGGKLILIDDFLTPRGEQGKLSQKQVAWLADFRSGWLAGSLVSEQRAVALAAQNGLAFRESQNLTPYMKLGRPRDQLIGLLRFFAAPYMRRSTYWRALNGGYAKQQCLKTGLVEYRQLIWQKKEPESL